MRALFFVVTAALVAGCGGGSSDPCAGRAGTCIALTVDAVVAHVDQLTVTVDQPTVKTEKTPLRAYSFPVTIGLNLPSTVAGTVHISVSALSDGTVVASGTGQANVVANRGTATVSLGNINGDMSASMDMTAPDLLDAPDGFVVSAGAPSAPQDVSASGGNAQATVIWAAPASSGGSPISSYTVTSSPGGAKLTTSDGSTLTATLAGLTNGVLYTFSVAATNAEGTGPAAASNSVTPTGTPTAPSAPTNVTAVANVDHGATVSWVASDNHGSPLQGYAIAATQITGALGTAGPTATSASVTGLTPGSQYTFTVTATNAEGNSPPSFPSGAIVAATTPGVAPTSVTAVANLDHGVTVSWKAPASSGFSPVTKYTVTASPGGATSSTTNGTTLSAPVTGLQVGTAYKFTVYASNIIGDGPASTASSATTISMHDTLAVLSISTDDSTSWVDFYDHYSQLPDGTTSSSRTLTTTGYYGSGNLGVDSVNGVVYVSTAGTQDGWLHADTISGTAAAPDVTFTVPYFMNPGSMAVDAAKKKLYVNYENYNTGTYQIARFGYTTPTDLNNSPTPEAAFAASYSYAQLYVDPATANLWALYYSDGASLFPAAATLATGSGATGGITGFDGISGAYTGMAYAPLSGGTVFLNNNGTIEWGATGATTSAGTFAVSGSSLMTYGNSQLLVVNGAQIQAWNVANVSGNALKTVSSTHTTFGNIEGLVYVP